MRGGESCFDLFFSLRLSRRRHVTRRGDVCERARVCVCVCVCVCATRWNGGTVPAAWPTPTHPLLWCLFSLSFGALFVPFS